MKKKLYKKRKVFQTNFLFSGGQDSSLLLIFLLLKNVKFNYLVSIIQHESQIDSFFVLSHSFYLTKLLQLDFILLFLNFFQRFFNNETNFRYYRYQIISRTNNFYKTFFLITGHNKTDSIEALFLNLFRGSNLKGLMISFDENFLISKTYHQSLIFLNFQNLVSFSKNKFIKKGIFYFSISLSKKIFLKKPLIQSSRINVLKSLKRIFFPLLIDQTNAFFDTKRNRIRRHLLLYIQIFFNKKIENQIFKSANFLTLSFSFFEQNLLLFENILSLHIKSDLIIIDNTLLTVFPLFFQKKYFEIFYKKKSFEKVLTTSYLIIFSILPNQKILIFKTSLFVIIAK